MNKYFGNWSSYQSVIEGVSAGRWDDEYLKYEEVPPTNFPADDQILFASYDTGDYSGYALVIYQKDGQLFEWSASHCSCNGISGEWDGGGKVTWEALALRIPEMKDSYGFLYKADQAARDAFAAMVAANTSGQALLDAYNAPRPDDSL